MELGPARQRKRREFGQSVWILLAPRRFASKTQIKTVGLSWISLDSLVRIEPFQWVALDFRKKKILAPFSAPGALDGGQGSGATSKG
jgi:hypothetical protein